MAPRKFTRIQKRGKELILAWFDYLRPRVRRVTCGMIAFAAFGLAPGKWGLVEIVRAAIDS